MDKKRLLRILFSFLPFILSAFISLAGSAGTGSYDNNNYYDESNVYVIKSMLVEVDATQERLFHIKETIDLEFYQRRASVMRDIPLNGGLEIRDVNVEGRVFSVTKNGKFITIDPQADNYIQSLEPRRYVITYTLDYSNAVMKNISAKDSITLNAVGFGIPVKTEKAEIKITLPETPVNSYYYVGKYGTTEGSQRLNITTEGNTVTIKTKDSLGLYEGITIGYDMPKGTMRGHIDKFLLLKIIAAAAYIFIVYLVFNAYGRDKDITPIINFIPPFNLNPAEAGYLIDGSSNTTDMTSLIYYWASKGHLAIKDYQDGKDIELIKLSDLDGEHKGYEKIMFNELFKKGPSVKVNSLKEKYFEKLLMSMSALKGSYSGKLFEKKALSLSLFMLAVTALVSLVWTIVSGKALSAAYDNFSGIAAAIAGVIAFIAATALIRYEPKIYKNKSRYYLIYIISVFIISLITAFIYRNSFMPLYDSIILSSVFGLSMCIIPFIQCRTEYYHTVLNELIGFRDFLLNAEKDRLETLLKDNPEYYYDILPYANVLGVSDIWMKKFSGLAMEAPTWYYSNRVFNMYLFNSAFRRSMSNMSEAMVSRPQPSGKSGGGFGGGKGGFGGGGFGGGGFRSR